MRRFLSFHQPHINVKGAVIAGFGGGLGIALLGFLTIASGHPLLMAPFGASCVLLFSAARSPLSQPPNVVGGHFVATLISLLLRLYLPNEWWAVALAVGLAIFAMALLRITHPPAGADPIVVFLSHPGFGFLFMPVLVGSLLLVALASLYHAATSTRYPMDSTRYPMDKVP